MTSIRRTLLVWLLLGLAAVAVLASVATYFDTRREIGELFDLQLKQLAYSTRIDDLLRGRQPSIAGPGADRTAGVSEIVTQIWDRDGVLVYYSRPGTGLPVPATEGYSNVIRDGHAWRVYTHVEGRHALQVAHALDERREIAAQSALRTLLPLAALIPFLGVLIWYAVGRGLRPLETMSRAVAKRQPDAMAPLAETGLPEELRPLAGSLNALLARLDDALNAQRRFTADAAHELRTPLAALKLQVELVERAPDDTARATALAELEEGVDRASHLVEQLLAMARLEPEALAKNFGDCDLVAMAKDVIVARAALAADRKIDLGLARVFCRARARRRREPVDAARQPARQCTALHARRRPHRRRHRRRRGTRRPERGRHRPRHSRRRPGTRVRPLSSRRPGGSGSERQRARALHRQAHRRRPWRNCRAGHRRRRSRAGRARPLSGHERRVAAR